MVYHIFRGILVKLLIKADLIFKNLRIEGQLTTHWATCDGGGENKTAVEETDTPEH